MRKNIIFLLGLIAAVTTTNNLQAQKVKLGAQCPNFLFSNFLDKNEKPFRLEDLKGKLVILDFWTIYCSTCVHNFYLLDSLQKKFKKEVKIINITISTRAQVLSLFKKLNDKYDIPLIVDDIAFSKRFPYIGVPNIVWIDKTGKFLAATSDDPLNGETIEKLLKGEQVKFDPKPNYSEFPEEAVLDHQNFIFRSILTPCQPGFLGHGTTFYNGQYPNGRYIMNNSIADLLVSCADSVDDLLRNRIIVRSKDSARIFRRKYGEYEEWTKANTYCYQMIVDTGRMKDIFKLMLSDLENHFQLTAKIIELDTICLVLKRISNLETWKAHGEKRDGFMEATPGDHHQKFLQNNKLKVLMRSLSVIDKNLYAIDETGIREKVNIEFYSSLDDIEGLNKELEKYGLRIDRERRMVPFFLIEDKLPSTN